MLDSGDELVKRVLDAVPGGVVHVARDGSIVSANAEGLRLLGFRVDELTKRTIVEFDTRPVFEDGSPCAPSDFPCARVLQTGEAQPAVTLGMHRKDGTVAWAVFRAEPLRDASGELSGAVVTFIEITARRAFEEALRASEQKWRVLAENIPDYVLTVERDGRISSINRLLPQLDEARVLSTSVFDYVDATDRDRYRAVFAEVLATGRSVRIEARSVAAGGGVAWYDSALVPLVVDGHVERVVVVGRDVSEHRAILARLAEKERLASVGTLAAGVAHEIMNPLTYVLANLELAASEHAEDPERRTRAIAQAREGARRMQQIVADLRSLSRVGAEDLFYVDARAVLESALRLIGPETMRSIDVALDLDDAPPVVASESRLCQVFINLLVNAAQAMASDACARREIRIDARVDDASGLVGIAIRDSGEGIAEDRLARVFEPFYTTKHAGTGLGLSITRDILAKMGGRIEVTSAPGEGATFVVWLPTSRAPLGAR